MNIDLLITNAALATCASPAGPKRGADLQTVGLIENGAVAVNHGQIVAVGQSAQIKADYTARRTLDAGGRAVCPGLVDCHTHVVYAGNRVDEFEQRVRGATYMEIMQAGGGIAGTMRATRAASPEQLVAEARPRLAAMLALGTTTAEVKTGYGLNTAGELAMLRAIAALATAQPVELIPTFLGAHAIPPEFKNNAAGYVDLVIEEMLPAAAGWYRQSPFAAADLPFFCDVFCEANVFSREQTARVLRAGLAHGLRPKLHADEFVSLGGVTLAVELGAVSVDHLDVTPADDMARLGQSNTVGVVLPAVNFNLGSSHFANARALIEAGVALALSTDINPGSAPCPSLPLVMALACRYQRLTPAEALNAVTINAAHAVGLGQRLGSIEPGKQADLLILAAPDYRYLAYEFGGNPVETVIKRGQVISQ